MEPGGTLRSMRSDLQNVIERSSVDNVGSTMGAAYF